MKFTISLSGLSIIAIVSAFSLIHAYSIDEILQNDQQCIDIYRKRILCEKLNEANLASAGSNKADIFKSEAQKACNKATELEKNRLAHLGLDENSGGLGCDSAPIAKGSFRGEEDAKILIKQIKDGKLSGQMLNTLI